VGVVHLVPSFEGND